MANKSDCASMIGGICTWRSISSLAEVIWGERGFTRRLMGRRRCVYLNDLRTIGPL